jgi:acetolactate synthase I/III small subunit
MMPLTLPSPQQLGRGEIRYPLPWRERVRVRGKRSSVEHIISVLVENKFGVLSRVANLFSGRGYNIEALSVAPTLDPSMSMMTIVTQGDDRIIEQIVKQLNKVIDVIKVVDLNETEFVQRETALIKIHTRQEDRAEALRIADIFRGKVVDSTPTTYTFEITGDVRKVEACINLLQPLGIKELVRTGRVAVAREPVRQVVAQPRRILKEEK